MAFPLRSAAIAALGIALGCGIAWADGATLRGPHAASSRRLPLGTAIAPDYLAIARRPAEAAGSAPFTGLLDFYRRVISPVDGDRCDMAPTCSLYAQQAFKEHGVLLGFLLTADRLLHEADERPQARTYVTGGQKYYVDPLAANVYWLPDWMR
jgi:hypothetical protein